MESVLNHRWVTVGNPRLHQLSRIPLHFEFCDIMLELDPSCFAVNTAAARGNALKMVVRI